MASISESDFLNLLLCGQILMNWFYKECYLSYPSTLPHSIFALVIRGYFPNNLWVVVNMPQALTRPTVCRSAIKLVCTRSVAFLTLSSVFNSQLVLDTHPNQNGESKDSYESGSQRRHRPRGHLNGRGGGGGIGFSSYN